ncbi:MAG: threonine--tRNA ligase [Thermoplasmatales archaeon]
MLVSVTDSRGSVKLQVEGRDSIVNILKKAGMLTSTTVAAKFNGVLMDLEREIEEDGVLEPIDVNSDEGTYILRHSCAHLLANAVVDIYKDALPVVGPVTEDPPGFYYDISMNPIGEGDLLRIEERMKEIAEKNVKIVRRELSKDDLLKAFDWNKYKVELIEENVPDGGFSTVYQQGGFTDFCRGPHVPSTGFIKHFKLLSSSMAYWKGKEGNDALVRIYGTAFPTENALKEFLNIMDEVKKRDHRRLGSELDLFIMRSEYGPAFPLYTPYGATIRNELMDYMKKLNKKYGWEEVWTPHAFKTTLWEKSGHMAHYRENMFLMQVEDEEYGMKPMNCPGHILLFQRRSWSYRDLPVRFSEFGTVYRYERSGVTSGLLRVRSITQDDGHAFVRQDQIEEEVGNLLDLINEVYVKTLKITDLRFNLSTRGDADSEKYTGSLNIWNKATTALKSALDKRGLKYRENKGEAAFYGPKIDVDIKDAIGRYWQLSTIQLDFFMPDSEHFGLKYIDENNQPQQPVMIHRAIYGSLDRFMGVMIEHFAGAFPLWLSPVQARVINISEKSRDYSREVLEALKREGIRADGDLSNDTLNKKIRNARSLKIPYLLILGDRESSQRKVSVRDRKDRQRNMVDLSLFISLIRSEIEEKELDLNICTMQ